VLTANARTILLRGLGYKQEKIGKMRTPRISQSAVQRECADIVRQFNEKLVQLGTDVPEEGKLPEKVDDYQLVNGFLSLIFTEESSSELLGLVGNHINNLGHRRFGYFPGYSSWNKETDEDPVRY
jgi:hypothetical protein